MGRSKSGALLARVNFPVYCVQVLTDRHVLVAGGGGCANTGVPNRIEIYELQPSGDAATCVTRYDTGRSAIMNCATIAHKSRHFALAAGMDDACHVYHLKYTVLDDQPAGIGDDTLRRRATASRREADGSPRTTADIGFSVLPVQSFQTVRNTDDKEDAFQKCVRYSPQRNLLVTSGSDGHLRIWKYPALNPVADIEAPEVHEVDIFPDGSKVVSVGKDGGSVWDCSDGSLVAALQFSPPSKEEGGQRYVMRACRFGIVEGDASNVRLFVAANPSVRTKPPAPAYLVKWDTRRWCVEKTASLPDMVSSLAVSDDGRFLGVGTLTGDVDVFIAFSLQRLYHAPGAHGIFVTAVEFLKGSETTKLLTGDQDASLVSVSVDNKVLVHHVPKPATMGLMSLLAALVLVLLLVYLVLDFFQL